jgi:hypothetical protein
MRTLINHIECNRVFEISCSLQAACDGNPERAMHARTIEEAAKEFERDGWIINFEVGDELHLACPDCVEYVRERG